jgi:hypothetical protein
MWIKRSVRAIFFVIFLFLSYLPMLVTFGLAKDVAQRPSVNIVDFISWVGVFCCVLAWAFFLAMMITWLFDRRMRPIYVWAGFVLGFLSFGFMWYLLGQGIASALIFSLPAILVACFLMKYHLTLQEGSHE